MVNLTMNKTSLFLDSLNSPSSKRKVIAEGILQSFHSCFLIQDCSTAQLQNPAPLKPENANYDP